MRLLLFLPTAVAAAQSLRVTPAVVDVHGGVEIELARDGSAFESPVHGEVHCLFGVDSVPGGLHPDGRSIVCTVPPAPGGQLGTVDVSVRIDPLPDDQGSATVVYYDASSLPVISEVRPHSAEGASPSHVRVFGSNFAPLSHTMRCSFGEDGPTDASYVSPTELACASPEVPNGPSHSVDLRVSLDGRLFSAPGAETFTFTNMRVPPSLSRLSPQIGPVSGGIELTLVGLGFSPAHGRLQCLFEGLQATAASFDSTERVRCASPAVSSSAKGPVRSVDVAVGAVGGEPPVSSSLPFTFYDPARPPSISEVVPAYGDVHAPPSIVLHGAGFAPVGDRLVCRFGGAQLTAATFVSTSSIRCAAPPASALTVGRVSVMAAIDGGAALPRKGSPAEIAAASLLIYDASEPPVASSVTPVFASVGGGAVLTVSGANFAPTRHLGCVFEQVGLTPATLLDASTLRCAAPPTTAPLTTKLAVTLDHLTLSVPAIPFTFHDPEAGALVSAVHPPFVHYAGGTPLEVRVHNYDPTADVAACVFYLPAHTDGAIAPALATAATHTMGETVRCLSPHAPRSSVGSVRLRLWAARAAELSQGARTSDGLLQEALDAASAPERAPQFVLSAGSVPLTLYDMERPPTATRLVPRYAGLPTDGSPVDVLVLGTNFAPTDLGLVCQIDERGSGGPARFVNGTAVSCSVPLPDAPKDTTVRVSADGGVTWSAALPFTFYDPDTAPVVLASPAAVDVAALAASGGQARLSLWGSNFAPTDGLRCGFGSFDDHGAQESVVATFVSATEIECLAPSHWWGVARVRATHDGGQYWSEAGPSITPYNTSQQGLITSVEPAALPVDESGSGGVSLRGKHFFRPAVDGGKSSAAALRVCRFVPLPAESLGARRRASTHTHTHTIHASPSTSLAPAAAPSTVVSPATIFDDTHARCATPTALQPQTAAVSLSLDGGVTFGTAAIVTFYDDSSPPTLLSATPTDGERSQATLVTLRGFNFNPPKAPSDLLCRFGAVVAPATFVHSTSISCYAPSVTTLGQVALDLSDDGGRSWPTATAPSSAKTAVPSSMQFVYYDSAVPPTLSSAAPAGASVAGGTALTLYGTNFVPPRGYTAPSARASCVFTADGAMLASTPASFGSFGHVACSSPAAASSKTDATLRVVSADGLSSLGIPFTFYDASVPPALVSVTPAGLPLGSRPVTLQVHGRGFAPVGLQCHFGRMVPTPATFATASLVLCKSPGDDAGFSGPISLPLVVSRDGVRSDFRLDGNAADADVDAATSVSLTFFEPDAIPSTTSARPLAVDVHGGTTLLLHGTGFRPGGSEMRCTIGGLHVPAHFISLTEARCDAPMGEPTWAGSAATVPVCLVYHDGDSGQCGARVTYSDPTAPPELIAVSPRLLTLGSSAVISLSGANFAPTGAQLVCRFGGRSASPVPASFVSGDQVLCNAPPATSPATTTLQISTDGGASFSSGLPFAYYDATRPAELERVWPPVAGLKAQTRLMLTGINFGPTDAFACHFGALPPTAATYINSSAAVCHAPASPTVQSVALSLTLDGTTWSTRTSDFTFYDTSAPPAVEALSRAFGRADGEDGELLTLTGSNFAPTGAALRCLFAPLPDAGAVASEGADGDENEFEGQPERAYLGSGRFQRQPGAPVSAAATFISITQIRCAAPMTARPSTAAVSASTDGVSFGRSTANYTYYDPKLTPVVSRVAPAYGAYLSSTAVTVYGLNFAPTSLGLHVRFGDLGVSRATFVSSSMALARTPIPSAGIESLSVPVEVALTPDGFGSVPSIAAVATPALFSFHNPFSPPRITQISPTNHRCGDGGAYVRDVRTNERIEVARHAVVTIEGANFAPMKRLSCNYRRTGETLFEQFEHSVPAFFRSASEIRCPIPAITYADDGSTRTLQMFFSVSNDGENYRWSNFVFTYEGGCELPTFTHRMYRIVYSLLSLLAVIVALLLVLVVCRRNTTVRALNKVLFRAVGLLPDGADGADGSDNAGFVGYFFSPRASPTKGDGGGGGQWQRLVEEDEEAGAPDERKRRLLGTGTLEVSIQRATRLMAGDAETGLSDPYVLLQMSGQQDWRTRVVPRTLDPIWNESHRVVVGTLKTVLQSSLTLTVMDQDIGRDADNYLGELGVDLQPLRDRERIILERMPLTAGGEGTITVEVRWIPDASPAARQLFSRTASAQRGSRADETFKDWWEAASPVLGGAFDKMKSAVSEASPVIAAKVKSFVGLDAEVLSPPPAASPNPSVAASTATSVAASPSKLASTQDRGQGRISTPPASAIAETRRAAAAAVAAAVAAAGAPEDTAAGTPTPVPGTPSRPSLTGTLEVHLVRANELMSSDSNGMSDPYVTLKVGKHKAWKSSVQQKTIHPVWDETMRMEHVRLDEVCESILQIKVFDKDFLGMGDDRLGNKRLPLFALAREPNYMLQLLDEPLDDATCGTITVLVRFVPDGSLAAPPPETEANEVSAP
ncbi:multiple c2 and transmembrane domain-containing protein 1-like isoform 2 [Chrysochromulina tobinii]|uniref:Multiple c2 and transmembrane domain-containing protein 1-like isoform 2 n=1 Tax=Chrysochromulina tobinii TaxID=1460289 RepID=A0A0M0KB30_9EUKA|nr:multiple c2 and transmembrane domain-containing protein 1-like isoform 2 [Chrysochromulina tobinii]|eukprot:KOO35979.1 multiple c2 and transmembrane domain-containing protein 1-like isoform 2 [Chrysochromulina sp. CCMP291]